MCLCVCGGDASVSELLILIIGSFFLPPPLLCLFLLTGKSRICLPDYFYSGDISEDYSVWTVAAS